MPTSNTITHTPTTIALTLALSLAPVAAPMAATPQTQLVSVNLAGTDGSGDVGAYTISADGRFVAFTTGASDVVAIDTNAGAGRPIADVFVRDLQTETTTLVSVNRDGTDSGNDNSGEPAFSADGRFVAFSSSATDLVATHAHGSQGANVFVRDLQTGTTVLASINGNWTDSGNGGSGHPSLSANGRFVAFLSGASDLVANDTNGQDDVFVRDLQAGTTVLASINRAGTNGGNGRTGTPLLSAAGRFVAFPSLANDLAVNDTNGTSDIFVRDLQIGTTELVSVNQAGTHSGNGASSDIGAGFGFALSPDGRFVAFSSSASDLVLTDTNETDDVFIRDLQAAATTLVSIDQAGTNSGNRESSNPSVSADGRFVAFEGQANDLVATDTNGTGDVFVRDLQTATTTLVSVNRFGANSANNGAFFGRPNLSPMSADGRWVAFSSQSSDLVATDTNAGQPAPDSTIDVFVRDLQTGTTKLASVNRTGSDSGNNSSEYAQLSASGRSLVFVSAASDLVANDDPDPVGDNDLFLTQTTNVPFARFTPKAKIDLRPAPGKDWFEMLAPFKLGADSDGIAPLAEAVTIQIGTFSTTIPAGSFALKNGLFTFAGIIDGVKLHALLIPLKGKTYAFWTYANSATLTGTRNPVSVGLAIGNDSGNTTITAQFGHTPKSH